MKLRKAGKTQQDPNERREQKVNKIPPAIDSTAAAREKNNMPSEWL